LGFYREENMDMWEQRYNPRVCGMISSREGKYRNDEEAL